MDINIWTLYKHYTTNAQRLTISINTNLGLNPFTVVKMKTNKWKITQQEYDNQNFKTLQAYSREEKISEEKNPINLKGR